MERVLAILFLDVYDECTVVNMMKDCQCSTKLLKSDARNDSTIAESLKVCQVDSRKKVKEQCLAGYKLKVTMRLKIMHRSEMMGANACSKC